MLDELFVKPLLRRFMEAKPLCQGAFHNFKKGQVNFLSSQNRFLQNTGGDCVTTDKAFARFPLDRSDFADTNKLPSNRCNVRIGSPLPIVYISDSVFSIFTKKVIFKIFDRVSTDRLFLVSRQIDPR